MTEEEAHELVARARTIPAAVVDFVSPAPYRDGNGRWWVEVLINGVPDGFLARTLTDVEAIIRAGACGLAWQFRFRNEAEMTAEKTAALKAEYGRLAANYGERPVVPDSGGGLPGDVYDL